MKVFLQVGNGKNYLGSPYEVNEMIMEVRRKTSPYTKSRLEYKQDAPAVKSLMFVFEMEPENFYNFNQAITTLYWNIPISVDAVDVGLTIKRSSE